MQTRIDVEISSSRILS